MFRTLCGWVSDSGIQIASLCLPVLWRRRRRGGNA